MLLSGSAIKYRTLNSECVPGKIQPVSEQKQYERLHKRWHGSHPANGKSNRLMLKKPAVRRSVILSFYFIKERHPPAKNNRNLISILH